MKNMKCPGFNFWSFLGQKRKNLPVVTSECILILNYIFLLFPELEYLQLNLSH